MCDHSACALECTQEREFALDDGSACVCEKPVTVGEDEYVDCPLPSLCGEGGAARYLCVIQALRYGVVGTVTYGVQEEDAGGQSTTIRILEPGRAQAIERGFVERACCDEISKDHTRYVFPFTLAPPDAAAWQDCLAAAPLGPHQHAAATLPACLRHESLAVECSGESLTQCPAPPEPPDGACEQACPMVNDGVCDEAAGSGLCPDGCDPVDCACPEDVPGECNDVRAGGPCPLGSDPECEEL
ncbi:MAG: hypothetical protein H0T76_22000 [Nannocystis sp.]|nr:hypothetical protein [Nannocystis sp.]MBA3549154.1 hypothetical protein [Nannocystis sp.]